MHVRAKLLASTAFANPGATTLAQHNKTPDTASLVAAVEMINDVATVDSDEILKRSPDISSMLPYWDMTDDIVEGYDAVKNAGKKYLPQFVDEEKEDYDLRLELTKFTNVYRDIVEGLAAKPFEEEVTFIESDDKKVPEELKEFAENVDGSGNNLTVFASLAMFNGVNSAIHWLFIDYPTVDRERIKTKADQKQAGIRPFWSHVLGRNILEAKTKIVNGKQMLSYIRIFEPGVTEPDRVRIFQLNDDGRVVWELYEKLPNEKKFIRVDNGILSISIIPLVPFITGRRDGTTFKIFPAMRDAADLQIKLYQSESALEYISNLAGYPMLAANGMRPEMQADGRTPKKLKRGPSRVLWGIPDGNGNSGSWAYVEPSAQSMEFLEKKNTNTKQDLRELGRQPLTANSGNLTVITTAYAAGKSKSAVSVWALALKDALENAFLITAMYMSINDYEPEINVYTEFDEFMDGNSDIEALRAARDSGDLSQETYWSELKRRKVLSPEFDKEEERERLLKEVPADDTNLDINLDDDLDPNATPGNVPRNNAV
jgi:hypothetical protein